MKKASKTLKAVAKAKRRAFPYARVARLWAKDYTIAEIAERIGYVQKDANDPLHSMRVFLHRMHAGWRDSKGVVHQLPHRISRKTLRAAIKAGKKAAK
jgi:hypothetical protein